MLGVFQVCEVSVWSVGVSGMCGVWRLGVEAGCGCVGGVGCLGRLGCLGCGGWVWVWVCGGCEVFGGIFGSLGRLRCVNGLFGALGYLGCVGCGGWVWRLGVVVGVWGVWHVWGVWGVWGVGGGLEVGGVGHLGCGGWCVVGCGWVLCYLHLP